MATLTVAHYIYLDRKQRYDLNEGKEVRANGVAVPVWIYDTGTSEPAQEVFCRYRVRNTREKTGVRHTKAGFVVDLPYFDVIGEPDDEIMRASQERLGTSELLLDPEDGGTETCEFRYCSKSTINGESQTVMHFVDIKSCEALADTLA